MKPTIKTLALLSLFTGVSQAAVTISGTTGTSFKGSDGATNILAGVAPAGALYMIIADTGTAGFLANNGSSKPAITSGLTGQSSTNDPGVTVPNASITTGGFFGGDKILALGNVTSAGVIGTLLSSVSIAGFESKNFAVIWFSKSAGTLNTEGLTNQNYGIIAGADWTLPGTDTGNFTFSATDATPASNYFSFSTALTAAQLGSIGFFTGSGTAGDATTDIKSATFTIIPEPSAALIGAIGALGLLRRRRI